MVQVFTLSEEQTAYVQQHADLQQLTTAAPERPDVTPWPAVNRPEDDR